MSKILWAIDPFEDDLQFDKAAGEKLQAWAQQTGRGIEPVFVLTPAKAQAEDVQQIEKSIRDFFSTYQIAIEQPVILINQSRSVAKGAECLVEYAKKANTKLILVSSHGRTGFARMRFGSFAEALLTLSPLPLVFLNRKALPSGSKPFAKVLWATDFSEHCKKAYAEFLATAKGIVSEIVLFHDVSLFVEALAYSSYSGAVIPLAQDTIDEQEKWANEQSVKWLTLAKEHGFSGSYVVNVGVSDLSGSVLQTARHNHAGLVAMASNVGPLSSVLLGGESYRVLRSGEFPVWIYGPQTS